MAKASKNTPDEVTAAQDEAGATNDRLTQAQSENPDAARVAVEHIGNVPIIRVDA